MEVLVVLIPVSLGLGALGLAAFYWALRAQQYDDPDGDAERMLSRDYDDVPKATEPPRQGPQQPDP